MLSKLSNENRAEAHSLIRTASSNLGVPYDRAMRILFWHVNKNKSKISTLDEVKVYLVKFASLVREFNQEMALKELRRQGTAPESITAEEE